MRIKTMTVILSLILSVVSCTKPPRSVINPAISVFQSKDNFSANFAGGIFNPNPNVALVDFSGDIALLDKAGKAVTKFSFKLDAILPFETGEVKKSLEIAPNNSPKNKFFSRLLEAKGGADAAQKNGKTVFLTQKQVILYNVKFKTMTIDKLLRSKKNDK